MTPTECCPGTMTNNGGKGRYARNLEVGPETPSSALEKVRISACSWVRSPAGFDIDRAWECWPDFIWSKEDEPIV